MKIQNLKLKLKKSALIGLAGLIGFLPAGCGSNKALIDKQTIVKPYIETALVSDYVFTSGTYIKGQVRQDLVNVNLNDRLLAFIWQNYSYKEDKFNERNFGVNYTFPINEKLSVNVGYEYWDYYSRSLGNYDSFLKAGFKCKGIIDTSLSIAQLIAHDKIQSGAKYYVNASKNFELYRNKDLSVTFTPSVGAAVLDNYYETDGLSHITPGIKIGIARGNFNMNFFLNNEFSNVKGRDNLTWGGVGVGYKF